MSSYIYYIAIHMIDVGEHEFVPISPANINSLHFLKPIDNTHAQIGTIEIPSQKKIEILPGALNWRYGFYDMTGSGALSHDVGFDWIETLEGATLTYVDFYEHESGWPVDGTVDKRGNGVMWVDHVDIYIEELSEDNPAIQKKDSHSIDEDAAKPKVTLYPFTNEFFKEYRKHYGGEGSVEQFKRLYCK